MKAEEFYQNFDEAFQSCDLPHDLRKLKSKTSKWQIDLPIGKLRFAFATNSKAAGLLPMWPGEFRLQVYWIKGKGKDKKEEYISYFQYTNEEENNRFRSIQIEAIKHFSEIYPFKEYIKEQVELLDPDSEPLPNIERWYYYTNAVDAQNWGSYFGKTIKNWILRFEENPESNNDWCWRVLWPHLERKNEQ